MPVNLRASRSLDTSAESAGCRRCMVHTSSLFDYIWLKYFFPSCVRYSPVTLCPPSEWTLAQVSSSYNLFIIRLLHDRPHSEWNLLLVEPDSIASPPRSRSIKMSPLVVTQLKHLVSGLRRRKSLSIRYALLFLAATFYLNGYLRITLSSLLWRPTLNIFPSVLRYHQLAPAKLPNFLLREQPITPHSINTWSGTGVFGIDELRVIQYITYTYPECPQAALLNNISLSQTLFPMFHATAIPVRNVKKNTLSFRSDLMHECMGEFLWWL